MKIVEFEINGQTKYAIRRWSVAGWCFEYKDLKGRGDYWWSEGATYFKDCLGTKEQVLQQLPKKKKVMSVREFKKKFKTSEEETDYDNRLERTGINTE